jgi:hypothetical protein
MKIAYEHSHLKGKEYLQIHYLKELEEIERVIESVDGNLAPPQLCPNCIQSRGLLPVCRLSEW